MDSALFNKIYNMSSPGTYVVTVEYNPWGPEDTTHLNEIIKSNSVVITLQ